MIIMCSSLLFLIHHSIMKISFVAFAAITLSMPGFVNAAVCDNLTQVDRCDKKECTFDVFHYPLDKDGKSAACFKLFFPTDRMARRC